VFRGGGFRYSGIRYGGHRVAPYYRYHHRHHFHRALLRTGLLRLPELLRLSAPSLPGGLDPLRSAQDLPLSPVAASLLLAPSRVLVNSVETKQAPAGAPVF
jgi:hypothetical protein